MFVRQFNLEREFLVDGLFKLFILVRFGEEASWYRDGEGRVYLRVCLRRAFGALPVFPQKSAEELAGRVTHCEEMGAGKKRLS